MRAFKLIQDIKRLGLESSIGRGSIDVCINNSTIAFIKPTHDFRCLQCGSPNNHTKAGSANQNRELLLGNALSSKKLI